MSAWPWPVPPDTGYVPDLFLLKLSPVEPEAVGICFLSLHWSRCFLSVAAGSWLPSIRLKFGPDAKSVGTYVPSPPRSAQVGGSEIKVIVTAKSASDSGPTSERDLALSLLSLCFGFSVLPAVCPGAAELGQGRGGMTDVEGAQEGWLARTGSG